MTPNMTATSALPKFACAAQHGINKELVWTFSDVTFCIPPAPSTPFVVQPSTPPGE